MQQAMQKVSPSKMSTTPMRRITLARMQHVQAADLGVSLGTKRMATKTRVAKGQERWVYTPAHTCYKAWALAPVYDVPCTTVPCRINCCMRCCILSLKADCKIGIPTCKPRNTACCIPRNTRVCNCALSSCVHDCEIACCCILYVVLYTCTRTFSPPANVYCILYTMCVFHTLALHVLV